MSNLTEEQTLSATLKGGVRVTYLSGKLILTEDISA